VSIPESDALDPTLEADESKPADESQFEKPKAGVYTMLLIVSFFALLTGTWCLHKEMEAYDFDFEATRAKNEAPKDNLGN
jgi:hypothetical protein